MLSVPKSGRLNNLCPACSRCDKSDAAIGTLLSEGPKEPRREAADGGRHRRIERGAGRRLAISHRITSSRREVPPAARIGVDGWQPLVNALGGHRIAVGHPEYRVRSVLEGLQNDRVRD